jgi:hypothetical protein
MDNPIPVSDKVISRLQKLLNLANKGKDSGDEATEQEAITAMAMAQSMMAKYNLSMAMIEANGETTTLGAGKRSKETMEGRAMYKWQQDLMAEVAKANFCRHFIGRKHYRTPIKWSDAPKAGFKFIEWGADEGPNGETYKKGGQWRLKPYHVLVGREVNVTSARHMFDYLCATIERLVPIESNSQRLSRSAMSWKDGCSDRLQRRLLDRRLDSERKQREEAEAQRKAQEAQGHTSGTALVIVTLADYASDERNANYELMYGLKPGTIARRHQEWENGEAERVANHKRMREEARAALAAMTPKQRASHERKLAKEAAKEDARWERQRRREQARQAREEGKRDWAAYSAGIGAGGGIGLDAQIKG